MPDDFGVYERITVQEYLDFFAAAHGLVYEARQRTVDAVMELTDLGDVFAGTEFKVFGKVLEGMDVVEKIAAVPIDADSGRPTGTPPRMSTVTVIDAE